MIAPPDIGARYSNSGKRCELERPVSPRAPAEPVAAEAAREPEKAPSQPDVTH